ncbi:AcrR family transcriptional regulator [Massilia sp. MP_M2]|uniref:TetR/AcrR family transcriptional regulator n=1 Tax=Massilia sp. MP_M2 TaxID=3071713 RepID=UPI00319E0CD7
MIATKKTTAALRKKGRPLSFDREAALNKAMLLFWEHGYEATSLNALTSALGVTPSSIYSAFGDKKTLFFEALELYMTGGGSLQMMLDQAPTARAAVQQMLLGAAAGFTGECTPKGCLLASAAVSCSADAGDVRQALGARRRGIEAQVRDRIAAGIRQGDVPADADADALAAMAMALIQGMSTLARDGAAREKLNRIVMAALQGWPLQATTHGEEQSA